MNFVFKKFNRFLEFFINENILSGNSFEQIQTRLKVGLVTTIALFGGLFIAISSFFEFFIKNKRLDSTLDNLVDLLDLAIIAICILSMKLSKNPLKVLPVGLYGLLGIVLFFSYPTSVHDVFTIAWYPFLITLSIVLTRKIHSSIIFATSLSYVVYLSIITARLPEYRDTAMSANYLELAWIIILSYMLGTFYDAMNVSVQRQINKYKDAIIAERTRSIGDSKMNVITKIAGGIAHEFNNPLTIILGYTYKMHTLAKNGTLTSDETLRITTGITDTVTRISGLTNALQTIATESQKQQTIGIATAQDLAEKAVLLSKHKLDAYQINMIQELGREKFNVECNSVQIIRALGCLLDNAIEAVKDQKNPWIKLNYTITNDADFITFVVENSGERLDPASYEKISQPFFSTKPDKTSIGMGLPIVESVAKRHQGHLHMPGDGEFTKFALKFMTKQPDMPDQVEKTDKVDKAGNIELGEKVNHKQSA